MTSVATALYLRISKDRDGNSFGVDRQRAECVQLAERLGWTIAHVFVDNDVSASTGRRRPEYEAMLAAVQRGEVDGIIAWHSDRLHRQPIELERFIGIIERHGTAIQTVRAGELDLSTGSGKMIARMLGAAARGETERAQERIRAQKAQAAARGDYRGGPRPFGYLADGVTVDAAEAHCIRDATARLLAGESINAIRKEWTANGLTGTTGAAWTNKTVRDVLMRGRNAGQIEVAGKLVAPARWDPIVEQDELLAVRAILTSPSRRTQRGTERRWLGSGIFFCAPDRVMICSMSGGKNPAPVYRPKDRGPGGTSRNAELTDAVVNAAFWKRLARPDAKGLLDVEDQDDMTAVATEREGLKARLEEAAGLFSAGAITGGQLKAISTDLQAKIAALDSRIVGARSVPSLSAVIESDDTRETWMSLNVSVRSAIVDALAAVEIMPAERKGATFDPTLIDIRWRDRP